MARYNPISVAVIDMFASSLGAFMILYFLSMPFTSIESEQDESATEMLMSDMNVQDASKLTGYYHLETTCNGDVFNWAMSFWGEATGSIKYQSESRFEELILAQSYIAYYMTDNKMADVRTEIIKQVGDWGGPGLSMVTTYVYPDRVELHGHSCAEIEGPIVLNKVDNIPKELPIE